MSAETKAALDEAIQTHFDDECDGDAIVTGYVPQIDVADILDRVESSPPPAIDRDDPYPGRAFPHVEGRCPSLAMRQLALMRGAIRKGDDIVIGPDVEITPYAPPPRIRLADVDRAPRRGWQLRAARRRLDLLRSRPEAPLAPAPTLDPHWSR